MKKLKNLKVLLVAAGLMGSLSLVNYYAMEKNNNGNGYGNGNNVVYNVSDTDSNEYNSEPTPRPKPTPPLPPKQPTLPIIIKKTN